jgi:nucleotide-binding universal stress UspA family protein
MFQRILVAVDSSPARHSVVGLARDMARLTAGRISVLHVAASAATLAAVVSMEDDSEAKAVVDESVTLLRDAGIDTEGVVAHALTTQIALTITSAAEEFDADLVILSPHHHTSFEALFNPRVSDTVAHLSHTAVLLAPGDRPTDRR